MIKTEADFEATLEEVVELLEHPFNSDRSERLTALLSELQTYKPELISGPPPDDNTAKQRAQLQQHLSKFEQELRTHHPNVMTDLGAALKLFEDAPEPRRELGDDQSAR